MGETRKLTILHSNDMHGDFEPKVKAILVNDCNNILKSRGEKKRYALSDRFNEKKSREMFV
ncbi:MAG: hypothetical protein IKX81_00600, partial [Firmicutes bacterium]|nr:hypothetical protein [Bacillota bacterium]